MKRVLLALSMLVAASTLAFIQISCNYASRTGNDDEARRQVLATDDRRMEALRQGNPVPLQQIYADYYAYDSIRCCSLEERSNQRLSGGAG